MFSPEYLAQALGKKFPPTAEQSQVIAGLLGPKLVVAGAGAGKTETMASRVVYLVANGLVRPEQVLGLTFTRKAAQQLEQRIRQQLLSLRDSGIIQPGSPAAQALDNVVVKASTYDAYAGELVREYGLLLPAEPSARLITEAERYSIAHEVVDNYSGELIAKNSVESVVSTLLALSSSMDNELSDPLTIAEHERAFRLDVASLEKGKANGPEYSDKLKGYLHTQTLRVQYLPLLMALKERQEELGVTTFSEQMAAAAKLTQEHPSVGAQQRCRYKVIMLDEYQDTSHTQRVLLRSLFGGQHYEGLSVTAVGDPMQSIYGWRGATTENLAAFVEDFPQANGDPAPKDQLTTSWRNPSRVLELANDVASEVFGPGPRPVDPLSARPGAEPGDIRLAYFPTQAAELESVAAWLQEKYQQAKANHEPFSAAVLIRANNHAVGIAQALDAAGVPTEIVGVGGLLLEPEVQDLVALATMLVRPQDAVAALRILTGPIVGLGLKDIQALHERARTMQRGNHARLRWEPGTDPEEYLRLQLEHQQQEGPEQTPGLGDAVADLAEKERYSPAGLTRIENLAAKLRHLRTYSLGKSLEDIFSDIETQFGIRTEVLARTHVGEGVARESGTVHLDRFLDVVANYPGTSLSGLLDYLTLSLEHDRGLAPGEVVIKEDRVQILTAHKAKGLEFGHVVVLHADSVTYKPQAATFLTKLEQVPGDEDIIDSSDMQKRPQFQKECEAFIAMDRQHQAEEAARLFYVALTRTEQSLMITGSGTNNSQGKAKKGPYELLELLAKKHPEFVGTWEVPSTPVEEDFAEGQPAAFPYLSPAPEVENAAQSVLAAMEDMPPVVAGELYAQWESDASALIEEWQQAAQPVVEVELPQELTASDMVSLATDAQGFARRKRRPVPFKPNSYAKRGTAFHAWVEELFHGQSLLSEDELPGLGEPVPAEQLEHLKAKFEASQWYSRTPYAVEAPFEFALGSVVLRGRMDAVFKQPDGSWLVVDWKTGRPPQGKDMKNALIQLAVYSEAWRRLVGDDKPVHAAFYYVGDDFTFQPDNLPQSEQLEEILSGL